MCRFIAWSALVLCCMAWGIGLFVRATLTFPGGRLRIGAQCGCLYLVRIPRASPAGAYGNGGLDFASINSIQRRQFLARVGFLGRQGIQPAEHFFLGAGYAHFPSVFFSLSIPLWLPILSIALFLFYSHFRRKRDRLGFEIIPPGPIS